MGIGSNLQRAVDETVWQGLRLVVLIGLNPGQPTEQAAVWPLALGGGESVDDARVGRRTGEAFTQQVGGTGVGAAPPCLQEAGEGAALELYNGQARVLRRKRQQAPATPIAVPDLSLIHI